GCSGLSCSFSPGRAIKGMCDKARRTGYAHRGQNAHMPYSIRIARGLVLGLLTWLALCLSPVLAQTFLPASQAFQLAVRADEAGFVQAEFTMAPAVYLYRERLEAKLDAGGGQPPQVLSWNVPTGIVKYDATFEKDVEVYYGFLPASVVVPEGLQGV